MAKNKFRQKNQNRDDQKREGNMGDRGQKKEEETGFEGGRYGGVGGTSDWGSMDTGLDDTDTGKAGGSE